LKRLKGELVNVEGSGTDRGYASLGKRIPVKVHRSPRGGEREDRRAAGIWLGNPYIKQGGGGKR